MRDRTLLFAGAAMLSLVTSPALAQPRVVRPVQADRAQIRAAFARPEIRAEIARAMPGITIDAARLETHEIRPAHTIGIVSSEPEARPTARVPSDMVRAVEPTRVQGVLATLGTAGMVATTRPAIRVQAGDRTPRLDVAAFTASLHEAMKDNVVGYMMELRQGGQTISRLQWNFSRRPDDGNLGWNPDRRMHVASVSKLITAIALIRLLHEKQISYDTPIASYLPTYWSRGSNVGQITFRHLLTHRSGIQVPGSSTDYLTMKAEIAAGVTSGNLGDYQYENVNFGLMRILIPVIDGRIQRDAFEEVAEAFPALADNTWDLVTTDEYRSYVRNRVFAPSGVPSNVGFTHPAGTALAYRFPVAGNAWNSGDLRSVSGGAGWVMSADQVLDVIGRFRRGGIVPASVAQQALDAGLGVDVATTTPAGRLYNKNGAWGTSDGHLEQSLAYVLPEDMELVVFANSPVSSQNVFFRDLVTTIYQNNLR